MDLKLNDKTVFISGSTAGIGFATAQRFLAEGAEVTINGRTKQSVENAVAQLKKLMPKAKVSGIPANFSKVEDVNRLLNELPEVDILINNAGIFEPKHLQKFRMKSGFGSLK